MIRKLIVALSFCIGVTTYAENPVFEGWYADPEGVVFDNTYWIYPTYSDVYENQTFFDCFSSNDLVNWEKHTSIIDTGKVRWAKKAMWAPAIVRKDNKYYLFFSANDVHEGETGGIGVAVADKPQGPFKDLIGKPLINEIINGAQPIDQYVYNDDGQWYMFYGGWGHCNVVKLNDDFKSLMPWEDGSVYKEVTPEGYTEGPFMLKRNGKYYFMWSEGGWGDSSYRVAYAISDFPTGPFHRVGVILQSDPDVATGAGHHSVIQVPGKDEYYIVYHRRPLNDDGRDHRHTCIDRMYFNPDGTIKPVKMTKTGVKAIIEPAIPYDYDLERTVDEIVAKLTLDDKVGQMCQVTADVICAEGQAYADTAKIDNIFRNYRVGSVLNTPRDHAQSREAWFNLISEIQRASMEYIGIPDVYGIDSNHGTTYTLGGILFPQEINMAASFNRKLVEECAGICAYETRASSIPWVFNPVMDLGRNPVWPRIWESFGEDPYINGEMACAMVRGYQGKDPNHLGKANVGACLKHYMAYGNPVSGKDRTPSSVNPVDLREKYFYPFKQAIQAGALSLMVNSGLNNGIPFHANHELLTKWLKDGLDWDGVIVTDWSDIHNLHTRDRVAADYKEAIMLAVNAGIDMSMTPYDVEFCTLLKELVNEGKVAVERIDDAVRRIIRFKLRLGLYENPVTNPDDYPLFGSKQHERKALEMALQSEILLKNEGDILPLKKDARILLTGPNANSMRCLNGGWSYTWQGTDDSRFHSNYNTIYEAFCDRFGKDNIIFCPGMDYVEDNGKWQQETNIDIMSAVRASADADVIVACIGENSYCETVGNINDLTVSSNQIELVKALAGTGKKIVLVLNEGRPRIVREIEPLADAVIDVLLPGNYGGDALAMLIAGDRNFSAKLPYTYPKWTAGLTTYDHKPSETVATMSGAYGYNADIDVQWPFGFGMSYTTFEFSDIAIDKTEFTPDDTLNISVKVTNIGKREGMETVILYSTDLIASLSPDVLRVRGFEKVSLKPGESKRVDFTIPASALAFVNYNGDWTIEKGEFEFTIANQKIRSLCKSTANIDM